MAAGLTAGLAGCGFFQQDKQQKQTETPAGAVREPASGSEIKTVPAQLKQSYETAVNVVDAGADHTGESSILDVLSSEVGDNTALYFPQGEYLMDDIFDIESFTNLGLVGNRALVRPPRGYSEYLFGLGAESGAEGLVFQGIDFDFRAPNTGARPINASVEDQLLVQDVTVRGRQDVDRDSMRFDVTSPDGTGRVEQVRLPDGGSSEYPNTGIYVGEASVGTLSIVDCRVANWPDNGLYASPANGPVRVEGGHYANNGIANIRVSGNSRVRNVKVTCDTNRQGLENMRGIRLRGGNNILVENAAIEIQSVTSSDGAITMAEWLRGATVRNTHIRTNADDVPAVTAKPLNDDAVSDSNSDSSRGGSDRIRLETVSVTGTAAGGEAVAISKRNDSVFKDVCIHQNGPDRDGIMLADSTGTVLRQTTVNVTGEPLVLEEANVRHRQIKTNGSGC